MERSIVVALLLLSPLFMMLDGQIAVVAVSVANATTQTTTTFLTLTGAGTTTSYQTFTHVTSAPTVTAITYTTSGTVMTPVPVTTVALVRVTSTYHSLGLSYTLSPTTVIVLTWMTLKNTTVAYPALSTSSFAWGKTATWTVTAVYDVPQTTVVVVPSPTYIQGAVTSQYSTNVATTLFSTTATTSSYATGQVISITNTQTLTSVSEQAAPTASISDMLMQNLWFVLILFAVVLGVLGFGLGRRGGKPRSGIAIQGVFCGSCGARMPLEAEFCMKCGQKKMST